jgi:hypothetical protein
MDARAKASSPDASSAINMITYLNSERPVSSPPPLLAVGAGAGATSLVPARVWISVDRFPTDRARVSGPPLPSDRYTTSN